MYTALSLLKIKDGFINETRKEAGKVKIALLNMCS